MVRLARRPVGAPQDERHDRADRIDPAFGLALVDERLGDRLDAPGLLRVAGREGRRDHLQRLLARRRARAASRLASCAAHSASSTSSSIARARSPGSRPDASR